MNTAKIDQRKSSLSLLASIAMPGLGHIYNGELFKGLCFFATFLMTPLLLLRVSIFLPDNLLMYGAAVSLMTTLFIYILIIKSAYHSAKKHADVYQLKGYNQWYFYIALWLVCIIFISGSTFVYSQSHILQFCRVVTGSMEPALKPSDFMIVDRTAYDRISPAVGDIVLFVSPDDRSKLYVKRITALPGDTVLTDDNISIVIPHGQVFVMGDNRAHAVDSRVFGTIPLTEIDGRARQIYFSVDHGAIRWDRVGKVLK
jgi:signal peptidase I